MVLEGTLVVRKPSHFSRYYIVFVSFFFAVFFFYCFDLYFFRVFVFFLFVSLFFPVFVFFWILKRLFFHWFWFWFRFWGDFSECFAGLCGWFWLVNVWMFGCGMIFCFGFPKANPIAMKNQETPKMTTQNSKKQKNSYTDGRWKASKKGESTTQESTNRQCH